MCLTSDNSISVALDFFVLWPLYGIDFQLLKYSDYEVNMLRALLDNIQYICIVKHFFKVHKLSLIPIIHMLIRYPELLTEI
eukprot:snap_masked-scaffold_32-processed-gene-2.18-mRNA-1 protein AED:1.00 eAED:1.00 QI:0/0/0/0/1/1/3/0/80